MSTFENNFINNTFKSLLKLFSNDVFTGNTSHYISDGYGNALPIIVSQTGVTITGNLNAESINLGSNNITTPTSPILGGGNNKILSEYSGILGGENNLINNNNSFIIGSNITSTTNNTLFVNNLDIEGYIFDSENLSGSTGQLLSVGSNGVSWITVNTSVITGDSISKDVFYSYTSNTNTLIGTKLNTSDFNSYSANTNTLIVSKLNTSDFNLYSANTNTLIVSKLNTSDFNLYSANTNTLIGTKLNTSDFNSYSSNTNTLIGTKLNTSDFNLYSANTNTLIDTKLNTSDFNTYSGYNLTNLINITRIATGTTIYSPTLTPSLSMPSSVGGISAGTTVSQLSGLTFTNIINDLLFPTTYPTYTIPTITIAGVNNSTVEIGSSIAPSISVSSVKNDAGSYTLLRILRNGSSIYSATPTPSWATAVPNQFGFTNPNTPNSGFTISVYTDSYTISSPSIGGTSSSTIYKADGNYNIGLAKPNNKNVIDDRSFAVRSTSAPQSASNNFESSSYTYTGIYPYFYGTSSTLPTSATIAHAISGGTATKVLSSASGTISIPYNTSGNYIWVAYFNNYTTKTKWYITDLNSGSINNSFITTASSQLIKSPDGYWDGITYKLHWSVNATVVSTLEYRNS